MRQIDLTRAAGGDRDPARIARLTRHLKARLEDFGPGGPQVVSADEETGAVTARFPGHDTAQVLQRLEKQCGVRAVQEGELALFRLTPQVRFEELALFRLTPQVRFEDLDYVWGCLFDILG